MRFAYPFPEPGQKVLTESAECAFPRKTESVRSEYKPRRLRSAAEDCYERVIHRA